jgi:hypothetical protein
VETYKLNRLEITIDRHGAERFAKVSYPIRYGRWVEIRTPDYIFQFNLKGSAWRQPRRLSLLALKHHT